MDIKEIKQSVINYFDKTFFVSLIAIASYYFIFNNFSTILTLNLRGLYSTLELNTEAYASYSALANAIIYLFLFFVLIYLYKDYIKNDYNKFQNQGYLTKYTLIYGLFSIIISMLASIGSTYITKNVSISQSENQSAINSILDYLSGYIIFAPITVIVAPIVEELIFRKSFFNLIKNKYLALLVTTIIFGTMHVTTTYTYLLNNGYVFKEALYYTIGFGLPYYAMGFSFGLTYIKSDKNILVPIAIHIINNFVATVFTTYFLSL